MVHGLPGNQGQPPVDAELGHLLVLHAVRPSPQNLLLPQPGDVLMHRFGQQENVAFDKQCASVCFVVLTAAAFCVPAVIWFDAALTFPGERLPDI